MVHIILLSAQIYCLNCDANSVDNAVCWLRNALWSYQIAFHWHQEQLHCHLIYVLFYINFFPIKNTNIVVSIGPVVLVQVFVVPGIMANAVHTPKLQWLYLLPWVLKILNEQCWHKRVWLVSWVLLHQWILVHTSAHPPHFFLAQWFDDYCFCN